MLTSTSQTNDSEVLGEKIRRRVDDRHWQLFEMRLKTSQNELRKENYTKSNDYRIIDRFKKNDRPQLPIEPNQRWKLFSSQLTNKTNENDRLISIFHNVWIRNWNINQEQLQTNTNSNQNNFLKNLSLNEHDKKMISSILHQNI